MTKAIASRGRTMVPHLQQGFWLGPWQVEPLRGAINGPGHESRHLEPKVMEVLVLLAGTPNQLVTREQLLDSVWRGQVAADQLLTRAISELRRALHDRRNDPSFIETVPKRGYRLIGEVRPVEGVERPPNDTSSNPPSRRGKYSLAVLVAFAVMLGLAWLVSDRFLDDRAPVESPGTADSRIIGSFNESDISIAVLPFVNMSGDSGNDYFSDGLSEEIRNLLATIPDLKVISRTSSFAFKGKNENVRTIGQELGVSTVLEGSVRQSGERIRITARLIDVFDGSQIWSKSYDRKMIDIFELQDDVASAIIDALQIQIGAYPTRGRPTEVVDAYALYLKAMLALNVRDVRTAESVLRRAIELDPDFAQAYELLAHVYWTDYMPDLEPSAVQRLVRENAAKALSIDPGLDFARALYIEGNPDTYSMLSAIEAHSGAARRQPNNPAILRTLSWKLLISGYLAEALVVAERLVELDPLSSMAHVRHAAALAALGRPDEASAAMKIAERLSSNDLQWVIGETHLVSGDDESAIEYFESDVGRDKSANVGWIRALVTGARDPKSGQAYLDERIPVVLASVSAQEADSLRFALNCWYLLFGYLDRYFEIILEHDRRGTAATEVEYYVLWGTVYRRSAFTAHPEYLGIARSMGFVEVWEQRGPPDFCEKASGEWVCK